MSLTLEMTRHQSMTWLDTDTEFDTSSESWLFAISVRKDRCLLKYTLDTAFCACKRHKDSNFKTYILQDSRDSRLVTRGQTEHTPPLIRWQGCRPSNRRHCSMRTSMSIRTAQFEHKVNCSIILTQHKQCELLLHLKQFRRVLIRVHFVLLSGHGCIFCTSR